LCDKACDPEAQIGQAPSEPVETDEEDGDEE
jgi:hypothetical protein